jgi:hypothetical protein
MWLSFRSSEKAYQRKRAFEDQLDLELGVKKPK